MARRHDEAFEMALEASLITSSRDEFLRYLKANRDLANTNYYIQAYLVCNDPNCDLKTIQILINDAKSKFDSLTHSNVKLYANLANCESTVPFVPENTSSGLEMLKEEITELNKQISRQNLTIESLSTRLEQMKNNSKTNPDLSRSNPFVITEQMLQAENKSLIAEIQDLKVQLAATKDAHRLTHEALTNEQKTCLKLYSEIGRTRDESRKNENSQRDVVEFENASFDMSTGNCDFIPSTVSTSHNPTNSGGKSASRVLPEVPIWCSNATIGNGLTPRFRGFDNGLSPRLRNENWKQNSF